MRRPANAINPNRRAPVRQALYDWSHCAENRCIPLAFVNKLLISWFLWALLSAPSADTLTVRVFRVFDGDSFMVRVRGQTLRIRIAGVDAPETGQPHGPESKVVLEKMLGGKRIEIETVGPDPDGYRPARVSWQDYDIAEELVRAGAAWATSGGYGSSEDLRLLETQARAQRRGLWSGEAPEPPWEWRARH